MRGTVNPPDQLCQGLHVQSLCIIFLAVYMNGLNNRPSLWGRTSSWSSITLLCLTCSLVRTSQWRRCYLCFIVVFPRFCCLVRTWGAYLADEFFRHKCLRLGTRRAVRNSAPSAPSETLLYFSIGRTISLQERNILLSTRQILSVLWLLLTSYAPLWLPGIGIVNIFMMFIKRLRWAFPCTWSDC